MSDTVELGSPWSGAFYGEVVGPSGRCFTKKRASEILGVSGRTVQGLVSQGRLTKDVLPPGQGNAVYLRANRVRARAQEKSRWPPTRLPEESDDDAWRELATRQGHDLDEALRDARSARAEAQKLHADLDETRRKLRQLELDNADLRQAIGRMGRVIERDGAASWSEQDGRNA
jgi:hypothetical protein